MVRREEIRKLQNMSPEELFKEAKENLIIVEDIDTLHQHFANRIAEEISRNNEAGKPTKLILPVGPTGQYPLLKDIINQKGISLKNCHFFFMDEYCGSEGKAIPGEHPLSFKEEMDRLFFSHLDKQLSPPSQQVIFPDHLNIAKLADKINEVGGIDTCYGGIGIHGHLAFNEPEEGVKNSNPRLVTLNDFTITINAIRSNVGGNLEGFPHQAFTLGMRQILAAKKICLYCRNGSPYDWANTILRLALFGEPGDDYPVTYLRDCDYLIVTDKETAASPKIIL